MPVYYAGLQSVNSVLPWSDAAFLAVLHCMASKDKQSPLERMFADFGTTPFARTVPVINGGVEVPQGPGLGADPEDELIAQFSV